MPKNDNTYLKIKLHSFLITITSDLTKMRSSQQSERYRRIKILHDYLKENMLTATPARVTRLMYDVSGVFPYNSHSFHLAEIAVEKINLLWNEGQLDRIMLFTLAHLMVFERYISTVDLKRTFIDTVRTANMTQKFSAPSHFNARYV